MALESHWVKWYEKEFQNGSVGVLDGKNSFVGRPLYRTYRWRCPFVLELTIDGVVLGSLFKLDVATHKSFPFLGMMPYVDDNYGLPWGYSGRSPLPE